MAAFKILLGFVVTALSLGEVENAACPAFWDSFGGKCYKTVYDDKVQYSEAKETCERLHAGAHLVVPRSQEEVKYLQRTMLDAADLLGAIWIGCTDAANEGDFECADGPAPNDFNMWTYNEPDNGNLECTPSDQDCVIMRHNEQWWDVECSQTAFYICQTA